MSGAARRGFRIWAGCAALSTLGDGVTSFALLWVAAGHGPGAAGLVLAAGSVPLCLLILAGGVVADRWGVRVVMVACDLAMAAVMAAFAVGALSGVPVAALVAVSFVGGTAAALRRPAAGVFPRLFADGDDLPRLMAGLTLLLQLATMAGPVVAGGLVAAGGLALTSGLDALTFGIVALALVLVRPPLVQEPAGEPGGWWAGLRTAATTARTTPGVPATILAVCGLAVTVLPLIELCVPLAGHARAWGVGGTGLVVAAWPLGGMLVLAVVNRRGAPGARLATAGPLVAAGGAALLAVAPDAGGAAGAVLLVGIGTSLTTARLLPRFVAETPGRLLARFQAFVGLAQTGPVLVATPALGAATHQGGVEAPVLALAAVLAATALAVRSAERGLGRPANARRREPPGRRSAARPAS